MSDHLSRFGPGAAVTYATSAAVIGGRLVAISGTGTVAHTAEGGAPIGVAARNAAIGEDVLVLHGLVDKLTASAAIAVGVRVKATADGKVATWASGTDGVEEIFGVAEEAAAADGDQILVRQL